MNRAMIAATTIAFASTMASAQVGGPFDLTWNTFDGGGITFATGGAFALGGTFGQFDASEPLVGGAFELSGGFWPGTSDDGPCSIADFAPPFGQLDFFDVQQFLAAFSAMSPNADITNDGVFDFFDVQMFLQAFSAGCP